MDRATQGTIAIRDPLVAACAYITRVTRQRYLYSDPQTWNDLFESLITWTNVLRAAIDRLVDVVIDPRLADEWKQVMATWETQLSERLRSRPRWSYTWWVGAVAVVIAIGALLLLHITDLWCRHSDSCLVNP